ncbi:glycosyltransferase [Paenibacillus psychroresistens]|uniref:Glycosyltransferase n=1 Tax=Paenibacillus psychroresistens TaxID=1778678 RepID=A0A6B8RFQ6_9BACL|nr:glycosyltransferase [Paenibacillus psychroresistens]QGQ94258.1 glycosyltransferase [Paenibacillus psychroresistens]
MKTLLFDHASDGHHTHYDNTVIQGLLDANNALELTFLTCPNHENTTSSYLEHLSITTYIPQRIQQILNYLPTRLKSMLITLYVLVYARAHGFKRIHFLYVDCCVLALYLFFPLTLGLKLSGTLHRFPAQKSKSNMLTKLLKWNILQKLVVHGEYTKNRLVQFRADIANRVESVLLPNLQKTDEISYSTNAHDLEIHTLIAQQLKAYKRPLLLAFGGLRHEKGIDLLLESLANMEQEATLLIAGSESCFNKDDLLQILEQYKIRDKVFLDIRYIPNEQVDFYFNLSDIIVLPYRKSFLGQSGPLTEGVARSKLVVGPNHGEIGFTLQHFGIGLVYESEDVKALAFQIDQAILKLNSPEIRENQTRYHKLVTVNAFKHKYSQIILANTSNSKRNPPRIKNLAHLEVLYYMLYVEAITNLWLFGLL